MVNVGCIADEYAYITKKLGKFTMHTQALKSKDGMMIDALFVTDEKGIEHCFEFHIDSFFYEQDFHKRIYGDKKNEKERKKGKSNKHCEVK